MNWETALATVAGLLGGSVGTRLWSTRKEKGDDYERIIKIYREELQACRQERGDLQQKLLHFMEENAELRRKVETYGDQITVLEGLVQSLEKQIHNQNK